MGVITDSIIKAAREALIRSITELITKAINTDGAFEGCKVIQIGSIRPLIDQVIISDDKDDVDDLTVKFYRYSFADSFPDVYDSKLYCEEAISQIWK